MARELMNRSDTSYLREKESAADHIEILSSWRSNFKGAVFLNLGPCKDIKVIFMSQTRFLRGRTLVICHQGPMWCQPLSLTDSDIRGRRATNHNTSYCIFLPLPDHSHEAATWAERGRFAYRPDNAGSRRNRTLDLTPH
ncbi:hypothetical protein J6590_060044 [Homalodisca vitripennis]|nr:hypothetical protein J6590_060044 [Homalodisca vitripennis]